MVNYLKKFWEFLKKDTWQSWLVSLVLTFIFIKFIFFQFLSVALASELPLVVVESCSMYHSSDFETWWEQNEPWYENEADVNKEDFQQFIFKNGFSKGDIILISGRGGYNVGDVIVFKSSYKYPLIHRIVDRAPLNTKGDNNSGQLKEEMNIDQESVVGKAVLRIPALGWLKLIFLEGFRNSEQRGFCR